MAVRDDGVFVLGFQMVGYFREQGLVALGVGWRFGKRQVKSLKALFVEVILDCCVETRCRGCEEDTGSAGIRPAGGSSHGMSTIAAIDAVAAAGGGC